jgi:uncharacterized membrane protein
MRPEPVLPAVASTVRATLAAALLSCLGLSPGCGQGDSTLATLDPDAAPLKPTYDQVAAILDRSCIPCHGGSNAQTTLASVAPDYSTCEGVQADLEGLRHTVLERGSMPPGAWPRLSEAEKLLLQRWLDQGACAPCGTPCP